MPVISVNVRLNDRRVAVDIDTIKTIQEFKESIQASELNVPLDRQKLIYSGRVLKDEDTVEKYGIQNGQTVHCVQTQASAAGPSSSQIPQASQPGQQPQQQIPTNIAAGAGAFNPFAGLTGARYAGQMPGLPNMSMFGPDPANALPPSAEQMQEMMNQPGFQQTMNQLLADPRMIDYLIQSQPSLQQMGPGIRQVMQSEEFRRTMTDPNMLRNMMQMNQMFSQMGMQVPGMPGAARQPSFPAPGVTNTTAPQQAQQRTATPTPQTSQQNAQANPFEAMFSPTAQQAPQQQGQAANPFAALFAPPPAGQQQTQPFQAGATNPQSPFGASYQPSAFPTGQTPAQNPFAPAGQPQPDLGQMISMLQSLQQLQSLIQGGQPGGVASPIGTGATSPPPVADTRPIEERFQEELRQLNEMGFTDYNRNIAALRRTGGNLEAAVEMLITGGV